MATKLPSGKYRSRAYYTENGKRKFISFTADTAKEADYLALSYKLGKKRLSDKANVTIGDAVEDYISSNINVLSPSTIRGYRTVQRAWIQGINNIPMGKMTNELLQRWINGLARKLSPKSVSNAWGLVSTVLRTYMPEEKFNINLPKKKKVDIIIPTSEDITEMCNASDDELKLAILLASNCGLRRGEISALKWSDVDLKKKVIKVRTAVVLDEDGFLQSKAPKSYAGNREVDITAAVLDILQQKDQTKPVCTLSPNQITDRFARMCKRIGMEYHFHLLRHFYCSTLAMLGVPEAIAEKLCGHSSAMVHKIYVHTMDDIEKKFREDIVSHFNC